jgi:putative FmdB family regulatory protein
MTYEYACEACGHHWEAEQSIKDAPLKKCVTCGKSKAKRLISGGTGFLLKGGGWYADGYGSKGAPSAGSGDAAAAKSGSSDSAGGGDSGTAAGDKAKKEATAPTPTETASKPDTAAKPTTPSTPSAKAS